MKASIGLVCLLFLIFGRTRRAHAAQTPQHGETLEERLRGVALHAQSSYSRRMLGGRLIARRIARLLRALEDASPADIQRAQACTRMILENARLIQSAAATLSGARTPPLPACGATLRVTLFARETLRVGGGEISEELLRRALCAFDAARALSSCELDALRPALIDELLRQFIPLMQRALSRTRDERGAQALVDALDGEDTAAFTRLLRARRRSNTFYAQLLQLLRANESAPALSALDRELERLSLRAQALEEAENDALAIDRSLLCRMTASLHALEKINFAKLSETCSSTARLLALDPSGVYLRMDDASRAYYRRTVARIARSVALSELTVAREAVELCQAQADSPLNHVGYYLLDAGTDALYARLGGMGLKTRLRRFAGRHPGGTLLCARLIFTGLWTLCFFLTGLHPALLPLSALVASAPALTLLIRFVRRHFPRRPLPALELTSLPEDARTLVVIPALLSSRESAAQLVKRLDTLYHAGGDDQLDYLLLGDYRESEAAQETDDADIVSGALAGVQALNAAHPGHFFYLHRKRVWDDAHKRYMGPMRKRGALLCVCELIQTGQTGAQLAEISFEPSFFHARYGQIITLDSDTILPPGAAQRLAGALLHPLCRAGIIAPRMESSARLVGTQLGDILGGPGGVDIYQGGISDMYQDICGRGSFTGKGIVRVKDYYEKTRLVPARYALSHDLLEGELTHSALMEDVALFDGPCARVRPFFMQLHRWTRGDWQLLPWLFPRVPIQKGHTVKNPLSLLSRLKIYDNLRRSLVAPAQLALLFGCALTGNGAACLLALLAPHLGAFLSPSVRALKDALMRILLLPRFALVSLDAAIRALYRQFSSGAHLLDWVTAGDAQKDAPGKTGKAGKESGGAESIWCALSLLLLSLPAVHALYVTVFIAAAFLFAPRFERYLDAPLDTRTPLSAEERTLLTRYARLTWSFFERVVTPKEHFLPPDNLQLAPPRGIAARTSPTNIGLYLLSCVAARQLGILEPDEMARRIAQTLHTLEELPKWRGNLYNWYDTRTLSPLPPFYVSSVDTGNLIACLIACAQALRADEALLDPGDRPLAARLDALVRQTDLSALYDASCDLFLIGLQIGPDGQPQAQNAHYDLLASEARLLSYTAVALRAVPLRHWQHLSRALSKTPNGAALFSWSGTMFEYMMPHLLLRTAPQTLLSLSCQRAVLSQMALEERSPWGVSESGCYRFDAQMNYQYHAFGLPMLSLRTEAFMHVVSPYAGALGLAFFPHAATKNLARFEEEGMLGELGFYEAADYTAPSSGAAFSPVKSHMSHHQGMLLCALANALTGNALVNLFHQDAQMDAFSLLLEERMPSGRATRVRTPRPNERAQAAPCKQDAVRRVRSDSLPVATHILRGASTTFVCDARGGGFIRSGSLDLTRSRENPLHPALGVRFYLKAADDPRVYQASGASEEGETCFESGCARYIRSCGGVHTTLTCCVDPLSGAVLHRLACKNATDAPLSLRVASYMEVSLAPTDADAAHRAFSSLFIRTGAAGENGVFAMRRARRQDERFPQLLHMRFGFTPEESCVLTDRAAFWGNGGDSCVPRALDDGFQCRTGDVVDPCLSIQCAVTLDAGEEKTLFFLTAPVEDAQQCEALAALYPDADAFSQSLTLAQMHAQVTADTLGLDAQALATVQRACCFLLYSAQNSAREALLKQSALPYDALYSLSLSGDAPVIAVSVREQAHLSLCREALRLYEYYTLGALACDLVFIVPDNGEYHQPVRDALRTMIESGYARERIGQRGGVHLIAAQETDKERLRLLYACAALTLTGGAGNLRTQVKALLKPRPLPPEPPRQPAEKEPLPAHARGDNGYGAFLPDGAYAVGRYALPPSPWCNVLANPVFGAMVSESGPCFTWAISSHDGRLTPWCNDPVWGRCTEALTLTSGGKDAPPAQDIYRDAYAAVHEPGATRYLFKNTSVHVQTVVFVPPDGSLRLTRITLDNQTGSLLSMRLCARVPFLLDTTERALADTAVQAFPEYALAQSPRMPGAAFLAFAEDSCEESAPDKPAASYGTGALFHIAEAAYTLSLPPHESRSVTLCLGYCRHVGEVPDAVRRVRQDAGSMLERTLRHWRARLGCLNVGTGDFLTDTLLNVWFPYQVRASRLYARAGFYQAGGAFGFRDQLQDMLSLLLTQPEDVRAHILICAAHQFEDGDVQHWWHPPARGVRTRMSDDLLFLPFVCAAYIHATGDTDILKERVPFLQNIPIPEGQEDAYIAAEPAQEAFTLDEHCMRAFERVRFGQRALPLIGTGDWNDAMNRVGHGGEGESVWLGFFFVCAARLYARFTNAPAEKKETLLALAEKTLAACEEAGWDGAWYRRAYMDDGTPLGSAQGDVCRIDCIAQCWAVFAGADAQRTGKAMDAVMAHLWDAQHGLLRLLTPPFENTSLEPGYIKGYLPGVRENGGQYTHGAAWAVIALAQLGRAQEAWALFRALLPCAHAATPEQAAHYRVEPYVVAADVYGEGDNAGRGGWTWYTGSASWMLIAAIHHLLGLEKQGERLRLCPLLSPEMKEICISYRYGEATYRLTAARGLTQTVLDGKEMPSEWVPLSKESGEHEAAFPARNE